MALNLSQNWPEVVVPIARAEGFILHYNDLDYRMDMFNTLLSAHLSALSFSMSLPGILRVPKRGFSIVGV